MRTESRWTWSAHLLAQETRAARRAQRPTPPAAKLIQETREPPGKAATLPRKSECRSLVRNLALFPPAMSAGLHQEWAAPGRCARIKLMRADVGARGGSGFCRAAYYATLSGSESSVIAGRRVSQSVRTRSHSWISMPLDSKKLRIRE